MVDDKQFESALFNPVILLPRQKDTGDVDTSNWRKQGEPESTLDDFDEDNEDNKKLMKAAERGGEVAVMKELDKQARAAEKQLKKDRKKLPERSLINVATKLAIHDKKN